jgi:hypothetical protein
MVSERPLYWTATFYLALMLTTCLLAANYCFSWNAVPLTIVSEVLRLAVYLSDVCLGH